MNINATLLGQMITFALFVAFTMRFIWPPLMKALEARRQKIADGLAAAERGVHELELARHKAAEHLREAKIQAVAILEQANKRSNQIIEAAKEQARHEKARLLAVAKEEITNEAKQAQDYLRTKIAGLAIAGAEKILDRSINETVNDQLLNQLLTEI